MDLFLFVDKGTIIHKLDPRTKLAIMFTSFVIALLSQNMVLIGLDALVILTLVFIAKAQYNIIRIKVILIMLFLFSVILWSISIKTGTRFLIFSLDGVLFGFIQGVKFVTMITAGLLFLSTTKIEEIAIGLIKLGMPYKGAFAFSTAVRLVPTIVSTTYTISEAQKSRGLDIDSGNFLQKAKKFIPLLIPTFVSVMRGTNVFSMALESKGFGFSKERTELIQIKMNMLDKLILCLLLLSILISIALKIYGIL